MRVENSAEYEAKMAALREEREAESAKSQAIRNEVYRLAFADGRINWLPITPQFIGAFAEAFARVIVSDGREIATVKPKTRFGRPMYCKTPPELVCRDGEMFYEGGDWYEPDRPDWWWKFELEDVDGPMRYAGGEEIGKDEISFVPTVFIPALPPIPKIEPPTDQAPTASEDDK